MPTVMLTSKRQATLPKELCEQMGVGPGDRITVEPRVIGGETLWVMRPRRADWSWVGSLRPSEGISHEWTEVERSIEEGWADEAKRLR